MYSYVLCWTWSSVCTRSSSGIKRCPAGTSASASRARRSSASRCHCLRLSTRLHTRTHTRTHAHTRTHVYYWSRYWFISVHGQIFLTARRCSSRRRWWRYFTNNSDICHCSSTGIVCQKSLSVSRQFKIIQLRNTRHSLTVKVQTDLNLWRTVSQFITFLMKFVKSFHRWYNGTEGIILSQQAHRLCDEPSTIRNLINSDNFATCCRQPNFTNAKSVNEVDNVT